MTFTKGHLHGKRIKKGQRLSPNTEFKKGQRPWNYRTAKKYVCQICKIKFENRSHGKPKYCVECLPEVKKIIAKRNAQSNKGKKLSEERRKQMSEIAKKLNTAKVLFEPKIREKAMENSRKVLKGRPGWNRGGKAPWVAGENNVNWKGGVSSESRKQRKLFQWVQKEVLKRDDYTCQLCNERGGILHVDHIQKWSDYINLRFNMENCRTLCQACHYKITFGKPLLDKSKGWGIVSYSGKRG